MDFFFCVHMFVLVGVGHLIKLKALPLEAPATVVTVSQKNPVQKSNTRSLCLTLDSATWKSSFLKGTLCPDRLTLTRWGSCKSTLTCNRPRRAVSLKQGHSPEYPPWWSVTTLALLHFSFKEKKTFLLPIQALEEEVQGFQQRFGKNAIC